MTDGQDRPKDKRANGRAELDEAVTPISGRHSVPRTHRPTARRKTSAVARKNWRGAGIVAAFVLLFAVALATFILLNDPEAIPEQAGNQSSPDERLSANDEQPADPEAGGGCAAGANGAVLPLIALLALSRKRKSHFSHP